LENANVVLRHSFILPQGLSPGKGSDNAVR
jgi:hypothetical protein